MPLPDDYRLDPDSWYNRGVRTTVKDDSYEDSYDRADLTREDAHE